MKIRTKLVDALGNIVKQGRVDTDKLTEAHNVEYNGRTYAYQVTSEVMQAKFVEVGAPVLLMDKDFE